MLWRKLVRTSCLLQIGLVAVVAGVGFAAETPLPAALPEDLLPGLKPLIESATKQSPTMLSASLDVASAEANRYMDASGLWPSLGASGNYGVTETAVAANTSSTSKTDGFTYSLNGSQPIFHWGALKAQADIGKLRVRIADRQYAEAYRGLVSAIRSGYLGLIEKKMALRNQRSGLKSAQNYLALQEAKLKSGRISAGDITAPRLSVDENQIYVDRAIDDYESSKRVLARLCGVPDIADDSIPSDVPKPTFAGETIAAFFEEMKREGVDGAIMMQVYRDSIKQAELNYKIAKYRLFPTFGLTGSISQVNQTTVVGGVPSITVTRTINYGVGGNWNIFDGFATRGAKLSALASKRIYEERLRSFKESIGEQARTLEKQIGFAGRLMDLTETRNVLAQAAVGKVTNDVKSGVSSQQALDGTILEANRTEYVALSARADFLLRWSDYVSLLGADPALNNLPPRYFRNGKQ